MHASILALSLVFGSPTVGPAPWTPPDEKLDMRDQNGALASIRGESRGPRESEGDVADEAEALTRSDTCGGRGGAALINQN